MTIRRIARGSTHVAVDYFAGDRTVLQYLQTESSVNDA